MDQRLRSAIQQKLSGLKVLVVDDMGPNIKNYAYFLSQMGFERNNIAHAKDGLQGLLKMTKIRPDLIITDWNMPMTDGLQMVKKVRSVGAFKDTPIIMITAEADKDVKQAKPYVNAVLKKPYTMADVEDRIYEALAQYFLKKLKSGTPG